MIGVCEERRRSQNEAIKGHFDFWGKTYRKEQAKGLFFLFWEKTGKFLHGISAGVCT